MPRPQSSVDRFLAREGWHYLGLSVTRQMVKLYDRIGWFCLLSAPLAAASFAVFADPSLAIVGVSLAIIGGAELAIYNWVKNNPDIKETAAPSLSKGAKRFLNKLVRSVVGTDLLGPKFMGRILRPSAFDVKRTASEVINPVAFAAFENAARAYNRLVGLAGAHPHENLPSVRTAIEAMPVILDYVARLDAFPEQEAEVSARINQIVENLDSLSDSIELPRSDQEMTLQLRVSAIDQLRQEDEDPQDESVKQRL